MVFDNDAACASADAARSADAAQLVYVSDDGPGIRRRRRGKSFVYTDGDGRLIRDPKERVRIRSLAVPPAWTEVWICPLENGHILATGRDARGRKQYIYHPRWRETRDRTKFEHCLDFAAALPRIRRRFRADMRRRGLPREKVLATIVGLLDTTLVRVGNADYVEQNNSFGLTTLRDRHAVVHGAELRFEFKGKSGKTWRLRLRDRRVARVVKDCQDLPGQHLFQYFDDEGERRAVTSTDVNAYLREISGAEVSAKDFRTWAGTVLAATILGEPGSGEGKGRAREAIARVAARLGNTPAICRACYIHPAVLACHGDGTLAKELRRMGNGSRRRMRGLATEEATVLAMLRRRLKRRSA